MPEPTTITLIASGAAAKKLVENVVTDLYQLAKEKGGFELKKWRAKSHLEVIHKRIRQLRLVKTIWQVEKEIDLTKFYYPSKVVVGNSAKEIHQLADLECDTNILVEGTVGQGKSIFLRYIASVEFCLTRRIPIFIELRRLKTGQSITSFALNELQVLGFEMDDKLFAFFADEGRLVIYLDAFDELKEDLRTSVLTEVEQLARKHDRLRFVVTSRPNSGASTSPLLRVFQLRPLQPPEHEHVIARMAHKKETADAIINGIRTEAAQVRRLLTTPLMVALLMVRYRADQSLPQNDAAFYESLFGLLLQRHDKSKGGYIRPRQSSLGDYELELFFNALAFLTRKAGEASFTPGQLNRYSREALRLSGHSGDVTKILADVIDVTCLILADGEERRFIHTSVQEYHAAMFIKDQPQDSVVAFYDGMRTRWNAWKQELRFLEIVDRYRFLRFFHIPRLREFLDVPDAIPQSLDQTSTEFLIERLGDDEIEVNVETGAAERITYYSSSHQWASSHSLDDSKYAMEFFQRKWPVGPSASGPSQQGKTATVERLLTDRASNKAARRACLVLFEKLRTELQEADAYVRHVEDTKDIFKFDHPAR